MDVQAAYRHCEQITWTQARNFSYGIRLLPPAKRQALAAVYAFARRIDDIGDGDLPKPAKLAALADARDSVTALGAQRNLPGQNGNYTNGVWDHLIPKASCNPNRQTTQGLQSLCGSGS